MKKLNIAIIGQGSMGRAHSNAYHQVNHFFETPYEPRLKVICGRNRAGLERMAATWGWEEISTDWRSVIDRKDIDVIDVAAPNWLHAEMAIAAAEAGKVVLCEKPLAVSSEEAAGRGPTAREATKIVWFT